MLNPIPHPPQWQPYHWHLPQTLHCPVQSAHSVQVWRVDLGCSEAVRAELYTYLSADERDRAARFKFDHHRHHFIAARGFLRLILSAYLEQPPPSLTFEYGDRGKPFLAIPPPRHSSTSSFSHPVIFPLHFNVSHSNSIALYAVSGDRPVGIDIESIRTISSIADLAQRFFFDEEAAVVRNLLPPHQEIAFFRGWTRKEAYLKATGDGLAGLESIPTTMLTPASAQVLTQMTIGQDWWLTDIELEPGFMGAIAISMAGQNAISVTPDAYRHFPSDSQMSPPPLQFFHLIPN